MKPLPCSADSSTLSIPHLCKGARRAAQDNTGAVRQALQALATPGKAQAQGVHSTNTHTPHTHCHQSITSIDLQNPVPWQQDLLLETRRLLDVGDSVADAQLVDDEESLASFVARNPLSPKDASVLFQICHRVKALTNCEANALGEALAEEMRSEGGREASAQLSLSKNELRWLEERGA